LKKQSNTKTGVGVKDKLSFSIIKLFLKGQNMQSRKVLDT